MRKRIASMLAVVGFVTLGGLAVSQARNGNDRDHWDLGDWRDWWRESGGECSGEGHGPVVVEQDDGWDVEANARRLCRFNKRKCVEVASNLAYRMAESGAYADLNDNQFAALAIKIAAHIVDNVYDHDQNEGPPTN